MVPADNPYRDALAPLIDKLLGTLQRANQSIGVLSEIKDAVHEARRAMERADLAPVATPTSVWLP